MNELVTAVITTYKREPEILRRAVESVLNQKWRPLELYVINDCQKTLFSVLEFSRCSWMFSKTILI